MAAFFVLAVFAVALGFAAVEKAGVTPDWAWVLCVVGVGTAVYFFVRPRRALPPLDSVTLSALWAFVCVAGLQLIPLPLRFVEFLAPSRVELARATARALGTPVPGFIPITIVPWETFGYLLTLAGYALVFLVLRELTMRFRGEAYSWAPVWPLLIVAGCEGALGFLQAYAEGGDGFARGTYANRDHYAGLLEVTLPFAVLYAPAILNRQKKLNEAPVWPAVKACGALGIAAVILIGIIHSLSRMAFMATLLSLFIAGSLALSLRGVIFDGGGIRVNGWRRWLPVAVVGLVVLVGFVVLPTDALIGRFADMAKTEDVTADTRAQLWHDSGGLVKSSPVLGCGFGCYESGFYRFKSVAPMFTADYAHNDYLQVLCEAGVIGFGIGLVLMSRVVQSTIRGMLYARALEDRLFSIACLASLTAILLHSLVDFNMYVPANGLAVAWIGGMSATRTRMGRSEVMQAGGGGAVASAATGARSQGRALGVG